MKYDVTQAVHGELAEGSRRIAFDLEAGVHDLEAPVAERLIELGIAAPVKQAKPAKSVKE